MTTVAAQASTADLAKPASEPEKPAIGAKNTTAVNDIAGPKNVAHGYSWLEPGHILRRQGLFWALVTVGLAFALRMVEWPCWQDAEYRLGSEWLLATHDAYHWVAGAEGFGLGAGHPMSEMLRIISQWLPGAYPAAVAFWFPMVLASLVALIVFTWVWALGSMEAGVAAGLMTTLAPGFLARTLLGYYDTDLVTLFFPLLMALVPACWAMRYMLLPQMILRRLAAGSGISMAKRLWARAPGHEIRLGNPLRPSWVLLLGLAGVISWWTQEWHSVFPYLIRYNVLLLAGMSLVMAPRGRRGLMLLGALAYALPTLAGPVGFGFCFVLLWAGSRKGHKLHLLLTRAPVLLLLWAGTALLLVQGEIFTSLSNHIAAYLKQSGDVKDTGGGMSLVYPSVAQSIIEVQDLDFTALFPYFHPWMEASILGLLGFIVVIIRRPGALFLLPLAVLGILSTKLGGRMVMFGAPIIAIGLTLPLFWVLQRLVRADLRGAVAGMLTSAVLIALLVVPFVDMIQAMSQGPIINRRHAEALTRARTMTPDNATLWLWWDWGYAAHHFARRETIADGAQHAGPSLYLPAAVFATDNPRFARQLIRHTAQAGGPGKVFEGLDGTAAQALMETLRSPETPLIKAQGRQFVVVSFEMLRLGFWISNFGSWNFTTRQGEGGALSIVTQGLSYQPEAGAVQVEGGSGPVYPISISIFEETGLVRRDYVQEWFDANPKATPAEQQKFLAGRRNVNFLFNRVTDEKLAMDQRLYNSLMVQLLLSSPQDSRLSPYFKLVYDNVFARIYEVL